MAVSPTKPEGVPTAERRKKPFTRTEKLVCAAVLLVALGVLVFIISLGVYPEAYK